MDRVHLRAAVRYILLNPVRAGLAPSPAAWPHSSWTSHVEGTGDTLVDPAPIANALGSIEQLVNERLGVEQMECFRRHSASGRPLGPESFLRQVEAVTGRRLSLPPRTVESLCPATRPGA